MPIFTEMCYAYDEWQFKGEDYDEPLTYEEEMEEYYNKQWSLYQELWNRVQQAGGEVPITKYCWTNGKVGLIGRT